MLPTSTRRSSEASSAGVLGGGMGLGGAGGGASPILRFAPAFKPKMIIRRHETAADKLWRHRGVLLVTSVPLLLLLVLVLLVFPSHPVPEGAARALHINRVVSGGSARDSSGAAASAASGSHVYNIVLDAGSTGSRIHIFKFARGSDEQLSLISDGFHQLKPGLSSFASDPVAGADSLKPLLDQALQEVPAQQQASTSISLRATAGLRLLPGGQADALLAAVRKLLARYPFIMSGEDAVSIMDGAHEGAFAWLTLNYLLGRLGGGPEATVAAIDLGGGSVQEAFALTPAAATAAPPGYVTRLHAGGTAYDVYVHSYLGYGLMAARAKVIEAGADAGSHPCFPVGSGLTYSYAGKDYSIATVEQPGDFERCAAVALKALEHDKDCGQPKDTCSFSGAWRGKPSSMARVYYVSSYFWDRAVEAGIITDEAAVEWATSPADFAARAASVCGRSTSELTTAYSGLAQAAAPYFCLDLSFCHTVLTQGFDLPDTGRLTLVKQVRYKGQTIEAAWPLGAAINGLSSASSNT